MPAGNSDSRCRLGFLERADRCGRSNSPSRDSPPVVLPDGFASHRAPICVRSPGRPGYRAVVVSPVSSTRSWIHHRLRARVDSRHGDGAVPGQSQRSITLTHVKGNANTLDSNLLTRRHFATAQRPRPTFDAAPPAAIAPPRATAGGNPVNSLQNGSVRLYAGHSHDAPAVAGLSATSGKVGEKIRDLGLTDLKHSFARAVTLRAWQSRVPAALLRVGWREGVAHELQRKQQQPCA